MIHTYISDIIYSSLYLTDYLPHVLDSAKQNYAKSFRMDPDLVTQHMVEGTSLRVTGWATASVRDWDNLPHVQTVADQLMSTRAGPLRNTPRPTLEVSKRGGPLRDTSGGPFGGGPLRDITSITTTTTTTLRCDFVLFLVVADLHNYLHYDLQPIGVILCIIICILCASSFA